jgi:hypothetical protein
LILEGHRDSTILDISFDSDAGTAPPPPGTAPPSHGLGSAEARPRPYSAAARLPLRLAASWALRGSDPSKVAPQARRKLGLTRTGSAAAGRPRRVGSSIGLLGGQVINISKLNPSRRLKYEPRLRSAVSLTRNLYGWTDRVRGTQRAVRGPGSSGPRPGGTRTVTQRRRSESSGRSTRCRVGEAIPGPTGIPTAAEGPRPPPRPGRRSPASAGLPGPVPATVTVTAAR